MYLKRQDILEVFKIISENKNLPRNIQLLIIFSYFCSILYHLNVKRKGKEKFQ